MRTELEVHEGVDMFKEQLNDDDTKEVNGKTLRAKAARVVSLASEYVRPPQKKKPRGRPRGPGRPKKEANGDPDPPKRGPGRPKKAESQHDELKVAGVAENKHYYILILHEDKAFASPLCDAPEALKMALKKSKLFLNELKNLRFSTASNLVETDEYVNEVLRGKALTNEKPMMIYRVIA